MRGASAGRVRILVRKLPSLHVGHPRQSRDHVYTTEGLRDLCTCFPIGPLSGCAVAYSTLNTEG